MRPNDYRRDPDAFWAWVDRTGECWTWTGGLNTRGYGYATQRGHIYAHRLAYELFVGPIPAGLTIDHLCRTRSCVRPTHLEAVTFHENLRRGAASRRALRTHCPKGHAYTPENTVSRGRCRICVMEDSRRRREERVA